MAINNGARLLLKMLKDDSVSDGQRVELFTHVMTNDPDNGRQVMLNVLKQLRDCNGEGAYKERIQELNQMLDELRSGPLRTGTFVDLVEGSSTRAFVVLQDGTQAVVSVPDSDMSKSLRRGDTVLIDAASKALLERGPDTLGIGEEARFERVVDERRVEIVYRDHEQHVYLTSHALGRQLQDETLPRGTRLLVCPNRRFAFAVAPAAEGDSRYRFLCADFGYDIDVEKDVGFPSAVIDRLARHVELEMTNGDVARLYGKRRSCTTLLVGPSGTGKTLTIKAIVKKCHETASRVTKTPIESLPPRVLRVKVSQLLSKWLGESDKNIDAFFDEAQEVANEVFTAPDGRRYQLPVYLIFEEADSLGARRGEHGVYDRIMQTLLTRLDAEQSALFSHPVIAMFTTNVPEALDPAFLRRVGGNIEYFGRLNKAAFASVLDKQLKAPCATLNGSNGSNGSNGTSAAETRKRILADVSAWLFSPNGNDSGQVELRLANSTTPLVLYRRDFLTGGLVNRAVQEAAEWACDYHLQGRPGVTAEMLVSAIDSQIKGTINALAPNNAHEYVSLPEGTRVASVRRLESAPLVFDHGQEA